MMKASPVFRILESFVNTLIVSQYTKHTKSAELIFLSAHEENFLSHFPFAKTSSAHWKNENFHSASHKAHLSHFLSQSV
jgi:hypothetical protein